MITNFESKEIVVKTPKAPITADSFLGQLAVVMADDQVKTFFADYFSTWIDTKSALMMIQTYVAIDEAYSKEYGKRLSSDKIVAIVREMICDKDCRLLLVQAMAEYTSNYNEKFVEAYQKVALKKIETNESNQLIK